MRWENINTCRWPVLLVISVPKIFLNGQFYFNLSSKTWSHVFWNTVYFSVRKREQNTLQLQHSSSIKTVAEKVNSLKNWLSQYLHWTMQLFLPLCNMHLYVLPIVTFRTSVYRWSQASERNVMHVFYFSKDTYVTYAILVYAYRRALQNTQRSQIDNKVRKYCKIAIRTLSS